MNFAPAKREQTSLLIALAGPSGSGKSWSALALATGLADGGKIAMVDTEARRGLHYAEHFSFDHLDMGPPFSPERFTQALEAAERGGYRVLIFDSFSHEYDGEGGVVEWAAAEERGGTKSPGNWAKPKAAHKRLMNRLLQARLHLVFALRADEKIKIEEVFNERKNKMERVVIPQGFIPIAEKRFMYEMTASFVLYPNAPGVPEPTKLQEQHRPFFPDGKAITPEMGKALARWAAGGTTTKLEDAPPRPMAELYDEIGLTKSKHATPSEWIAAYRDLMGTAADTDRPEIARHNIERLRKLGERSDDIREKDLRVAEHLIEPAGVAA